MYTNKWSRTQAYGNLSREGLGYPLLAFLNFLVDAIMILVLSTYENSDNDIYWNRKLSDLGYAGDVTPQGGHWDRL